MKLMHFFISTLLLASLIISNTFALSEGELDRFNLILSQQNHVAGDFEQIKHLSILPMPILSSGNFKFDQETGLNWIVLKPIYSQMVLDDSGIRQIQDGKVVWSLDASQPAASHISTIIASVLAADWEKLSDHFILSSEEQGSNWIINLLPKSQVLLTAISRIQMTGSAQLQKMTLFEANGDSTVIIFNIRLSS